MNNCSGNYSARLRSRTKQPVYTSDKRAKFTQRENKKWIRFVTVLGYIFFVSLPAVSLSIYYVYIWDPGYINKFPADTANTSTMLKPPILSARLERRNVEHDEASSFAKELRQSPPQQTRLHTSDPPSTVDLAAILAEGSKSMESSSAETGSISSKV